MAPKDRMVTIQAPDQMQENIKRWLADELERMSKEKCILTLLMKEKIKNVINGDNLIIKWCNNCGGKSGDTNVVNKAGETIYDAEDNFAPKFSKKEIEHWSKQGELKYRIRLCGRPPEESTLLHELIHVIKGTELDAHVFEEFCYGKAMTKPKWQQVLFKDIRNNRREYKPWKKDHWLGEFVIWNTDTGEVWVNDGTKNKPKKGKKLAPKPNGSPTITVQYPDIVLLKKKARKKRNQIKKEIEARKRWIKSLKEMIKVLENIVGQENYVKDLEGVVKSLQDQIKGLKADAKMYNSVL